MDASRPNAESAPTTDVPPPYAEAALRDRLTRMGYQVSRQESSPAAIEWKWWDGKDPLPGQDIPAIDEPSVEVLTVLTWKEWLALSAASVVAALGCVLAIIGAITV